MIIAKVKNQNINLFYDDVVSDSVKYLKIRFEFSDDWSGYTKTAIFRNEKTDTTITVLMESGETLYVGANTCLVPHEVIKSPEFTVSVCGILSDSTITSDAKKVTVHESGYRQGETPAEPTPSEYERIAQLSATAVQIATSVREDADNGVFDGEKGDPGPMPDMSDYYNKAQVDNKVAYKQDAFANVTEEAGDSTLAPGAGKQVLLSGRFRFIPDPNAEENEYDIVNRLILDAHHDSQKANASDVYVRSQTYSKGEVDTALANKQNTLTPGNNITILNDVISAGGGAGWRAIANYTVTSGSEARYYTFEVDTENNPFNLRQARIYVFCPAESDATGYNGYVYLSSSEHPVYNVHYGPVNWKSATKDCSFFADIYAFENAPAYMRFADNLDSASFLTSNEKVSIGNPATVYGQIQGIKVLLNSGVFKAGTKIVIEGLDK